jgi:hypothetical protein
VSDLVAHVSGQQRDGAQQLKLISSQVSYSHEMMKRENPLPPPSATTSLNGPERKKEVRGIKRQECKASYNGTEMLER